MTKKVLILSSSPRRNGNSDTLCNEFMRGAVESGHTVEKIFLRDKTIHYCTGCSTCSFLQKPCPQKDDAAEVIEKMVAADVIVLGTPVYFYAISAQMKTLIDRCCGRYTEMTGKEFYFISAAAEDDDAIAQGEAGTAPIMALVGGNAVTVKPKAATPKVAKHVLEDSTAAWQKAADATVADDLYWRLSATVPAGLTAYDTYTVQLVDTMSAGLDPSKVAASMRVYVAAGADGGFDAVSTSKDGRAGTEPAKGWTDITAQCKVSVDGKTFTVRTGDLIAALDGADAFTAGARVVAVYNAPLNSACNHGIAKGNPNEVYLRYPRSPFADQSGDAGFTRTPSDDACAYTWDLALTKRGSDGDKPLPGAVLSIADDRGRTLAADGTWDAEGKATVTTGEDGRVTVSGVDSGKLEVRELKAPKGYTAFEGTRSVTVTAEGLDVDQVAAAKPKLTITAESPLRADSADGSTGSLEASLINTPTGTPPSIITGGFMPSTGDMAMYAAAAAAVAGAALIVVALLVKRGGGSHKE